MCEQKLTVPFLSSKFKIDVFLGGGAGVAIFVVGPFLSAVNMMPFHLSRPWLPWCILSGMSWSEEAGDDW